MYEVDVHNLSLPQTSLYGNWRMPLVYKKIKVYKKIMCSLNLYLNISWRYLHLFRENKSQRFPFNHLCFTRKPFRPGTHQFLYPFCKFFTLYILEYHFVHSVSGNCISTCKVCLSCTINLKSILKLKIHESLFYY